MQVKISDTETITVLINHLPHADSVLLADFAQIVRDPSNVNRITLCQLFDQDNQPISVGASVCVKSDQFVRKIGARNSLRKALEKTNFNRAERTKIYNIMFGGDSHVCKKECSQPMLTDSSTESCKASTV